MAPSSSTDCMDPGGISCVTSDQISIAGLPTPALDNSGYHVFFALVIMTAVSGLTVIARIWTRLYMQQMGPDDYTILFAMASCIVQMTLWGLSVRWGYGADYLLLDEEHRIIFNKWWFLGAVFYPVTQCAYKTSVLLLNKRIFVQKPFQLVSLVVIVINVCWGLGNTLGWIFQCIPVKMMWGAASEGTCFNMDVEWISLVAWNVSTDFVILTMPLPMVWKLNLKRRDKMLLSGVFLLGTAVMICSILSCSAISSSLQAEDEDNTLTFALANIFQVLESNMGITVSCLPVLRRPIRRIFPSLFSSTRRSSMSRGKYYNYQDDRSGGTDYPLQNVSNHSKGSSSHGGGGGRRPTWRDSSSHARPSDVGLGSLSTTMGTRKSDELGIISEASNSGGGDNTNVRTYVDYDNSERRAAPRWEQHLRGGSKGIKKTVEVAVNRH